MPSTQTLLHRWFEEVWNQGREATIDELMATDCLNHGLADEHGNDAHSVAAFRAYWHKLRREFPDVHISVEDALTEGDRIAAHCLVKATHAPSGKPVEFTGITIARWKDGQCIEAWNNYDFAKMQAQLA
jgi:predicted ester cyclase